VDSEILHVVKAGDVELCAWTSKQIFCVRDCLSLAFTLLILLGVVFLLLLHLLFISCIIFIILTGRFHSSQQEGNLRTSTLNLEEYKGEVLEPFTGNPASLLVLSW